MNDFCTIFEAIVFDLRAKSLAKYGGTFNDTEVSILSIEITDSKVVKIKYHQELKLKSIRYGFTSYSIETLQEIVDKYLKQK